MVWLYVEINDFEENYLINSLLFNSFLFILDLVCCNFFCVSYVFCMFNDKFFVKWSLDRNRFFFFYKFKVKFFENIWIKGKRKLVNLYSKGESKFCYIDWINNDSEIF